MICHICLTEEYEQLSFNTYFKQQSVICSHCRKSFCFEEVRRCPHCHKKLQPEEESCTDCLFMSTIFMPLNQHICLYDYDDWTKELIAKYKFHRDIVLAEVFAELLKPHMKQMDYDMLIPMPSSPEKIRQRGFDHITEIIRVTGLPFHMPLKTKHRIKQAGLTKAERLKEGNPFYVEGETGQNILLVDDIYTTGLTVHRAAETLRKENVSKVSVLTFARV